MAMRVLLWGAPTKCDANAPFQASFEQSGKNYGNILIGKSVEIFLSGNEILCRSELGSPSEANERCDHVVIPASNFLWKDFDFGYMADFLEKTKLPITMIGVGAQTNDRTMVSPIHPNTLRLMHLIAERSASIGVRGFYTAEVLAANGIHNVKVIGCPSLYMSRCPTVKVDTTRLSSLENLSVNFSRRVYKHAFNPDRMQALENALLRFALNYNSTFVAQDELEEISLCSGAETNVSPITSYFHQVENEQVVQFFKENTRYFCDVNRWSAFIQTQSASIGSRFHGNLIALTNGVPALTIVHDSRTVEMTALMGSPTIHVNQLGGEWTSETGLLEMLTSCSFDRFESNYKVLYKRFVSFLNENGLTHNLPNTIESN